MKLTIATRGSQLALWQAEHVKSELQKLDNSLQIDLKVLKTKGDILLDTSLAKIGGKGLFVKEIENALLVEEADIAVHSMKDMPAELPQGLMLASILEREDPRDAFVSNKYSSLSELPEGAVIGTSSLRRSSQLLAAGKYEIQLLRGNVNSRLQKLDDGMYDAIILATAGLKRLKFNDRITESLPITEMIPSAGQGAVGVECRQNDLGLRELLNKLTCQQTWNAVQTEREFNAVVGGSCQIPAGCHVTFDNDTFTGRGFIAEIDGSRVFADKFTGKIAELSGSGEKLGKKLLEDGGREIINKILG